MVSKSIQPIISKPKIRKFVRSELTKIFGDFLVRGLSFPNLHKKIGQSSNLSEIGTIVMAVEAKCLDNINQFSTGGHGLAKHSEHLLVQHICDRISSIGVVDHLAVIVLKEVRLMSLSHIQFPL